MNKKHPEGMSWKKMGIAKGRETDMGGVSEEKQNRRRQKDAGWVRGEGVGVGWVRGEGGGEEEVESWST